jgi:hypothetical protein
MKSVPRALVTICLVLIGGVIGLCLWWQSVNGPPYLLSIKPSGESAVVKFEQRDSREGGDLVSPSIAVPIRVDHESAIELSSGHVQVPGGIIEFADTTLMPGRFRIRFGDETLDVMEARIIVDGVDRAWIPKQ